MKFHQEGSATNGAPCLVLYPDASVSCHLTFSFRLEHQEFRLEVTLQAETRSQAVVRAFLVSTEQVITEAA